MSWMFSIHTTHSIQSIRHSDQNSCTPRPQLFQNSRKARMTKSHFVSTRDWLHRYAECGLRRRSDTLKHNFPQGMEGGSHQTCHFGVSRSLIPSPYIYPDDESKQRWRLSPDTKELSQKKHSVREETKNWMNTQGCTSKGSQTSGAVVSALALRCRPTHEPLPRRAGGGGPGRTQPHRVWDN